MVPKEGTDIREQVFRAFANASCPLLLLYHSRTTLEDVFLELTQGAEASPTVEEAMREAVGKEDEEDAGDL